MNKLVNTNLGFLLQNGMTALFLACSHGNYEIMKVLVEELADVNAKATVSHHHSTTLHYIRVLPNCICYT